MSCLADLPELVGFFSYSRRDDLHSAGALSRLRARIYDELRLQLGREFRLWQDTAAIPEGALWEDEINRAIAESVFFIPIVTPSAVLSGHCRLEFQSFLNREAVLGRSNLIFPILYVRVPALEREEDWRKDEVLKIIGSRQYIDWQRFRHRNFADAEVAEKIEQYCRNIVESLRQSWISPEERRRSAEAEKQRIAKEEEQRREAAAEKQRIAKEEEQRRETAAENQRIAKEDEQRREAARRREEAEAAARASATAASEREEAPALSRRDSASESASALAPAEIASPEKIPPREPAAAMPPPPSSSPGQRRALSPQALAGIAVLVAALIGGIYLLTSQRNTETTTSSPQRSTTASALKFDGTYTGSVSTAAVPEHFRFYDNGTVIYHRGGGWTPTESTFTKEAKDYYPSKYTENGDSISFSITDQFGTMDYRGTVLPGQLNLNWHSHINNADGAEILKFQRW